MSLLTDRKAFEQWYACNAFDYERNPIGSRECGLQWAAWQAAQAALIKKLATVSVEPVAWHDEEFDMAYTASELAGEPSDPTMFPPLFTTSAIAAARVQSVNECAELVKQWGALGGQIQTAMRALISGRMDITSSRPSLAPGQPL